MSDCVSSPGPLEDRLTAALPRLRAHLARRVPGAESDDLAQEVLLRALRYGAGFDPARRLWPWLERVADRVVVDHHARAARRPEVHDALDPAAPELAPAAESLDEVARALERLSDVERDVLLRFHRAGDSVAEIARALSMPEGTVKSHLHRARRRLVKDPGQEGRT